MVRLNERGGPEVLRVAYEEQQRPSRKELWLDQAINYLDAIHRNGAVAIASPSGPCLEGTGIVREVGKGMANVAAGERVTYALGPLGASAVARVYPTERMEAIPDAINSPRPQPRGSRG